MATAKGKFKLEWYGKDVLKAVAAVTKEEEKATAERIFKRARKYVPVGSHSRAVRPGEKRWKSKQPGRLKASIKVYKSRFTGGGFIVFAGDDNDTFYAYFIEYGTIFMEKRKGYKFLRKAISLERARFIRQLRKRLGV